MWSWSTLLPPSGIMIYNLLIQCIKIILVHTKGKIIIVRLVYIFYNIAIAFSLLRLFMCNTVLRIDKLHFLSSLWRDRFEPLFSSVCLRMLLLYLNIIYRIGGTYYFWNFINKLINSLEQLTALWILMIKTRNLNTGNWRQLFIKSFCICILTPVPSYIVYTLYTCQCRF